VRQGSGPRADVRQGADPGAGEAWAGVPRVRSRDWSIRTRRREAERNDCIRSAGARKVTPSSKTSCWTRPNMAPMAIQAVNAACALFVGVDTRLGML
jgi:hypothetical protein